MKSNDARGARPKLAKVIKIRDRRASSSRPQEPGRTPNRPGKANSGSCLSSNRPVKPTKGDGVVIRLHQQKKAYQWNRAQMVELARKDLRQQKLRQFAEAERLRKRIRRQAYSDLAVNALSAGCLVMMAVVLWQLMPESIHAGEGLLGKIMSWLQPQDSSHFIR